MSPPPKITLYTSKISIYGQRVNILLHHLQVPFTEILIPLDQPRETWYLAINPRGMVPTLEVEDIVSGKKVVVVESALICHFLLDLAQGWEGEFAARADEVFPHGHDLAIATKRYRQRLFLDTSFEKLRAAGRALQKQRTQEAQTGFVAAAKEIDVVCPQPGHYFGDSNTVSLVEVLVGPYMMRVDANIRWRLMPNGAEISDKLQAEAPRFYAWMKLLAADKAIKAGTWDEEVQRKYITDSLVKAGIQVSK